MTSLTDSAAWQALIRHYESLQASKTSLAALIESQKDRLARCAVALDGLTLNYALNLATGETIDLLTQLAQQRGVEEWRERMFAGQPVNSTENRAVLHTALRAKDDASIMANGRDVMPDILATRHRMGKFVEGVRAGNIKSATGRPFRNIVNIGIGGSDLGPRLATQALAASASGPQVHFVANADAWELSSLLTKLDPESALFVIVSKTFTTQETLLNANLARDWLAESLGENAIQQQAVAVSSNVDKALEFGIGPDKIFPMWDWVGGRYSLWSSVGIGIALSLGMELYGKLLAGAAAMDEHFRTAELSRNMPCLMAMLGIWQHNFCGTAPARAILPYSERLRDLPRYLQQLEMESNGKSITREAMPVETLTVPVIFGECGTVGQHSFHQALHQGTQVVPVEMVGIVNDDLGHPENHRTLLSNMVAQAVALAFGQECGATPFDTYPGNRPCTILTLDRLDPYRLGLLLALYEHKVFVQGIIWGINSFDQPGVELGKRLARELAEPSKANSGTSRPDLAFLASLYKTVSPEE
ncbi:MAG: glucose-6-phosphate isomerase [Bdellovibrionales bacterium]